MSDRAAAPQASTRAPRIVGNYVLSAPIAVGGMASVHLAVLRDDRSRVFAVKRPHARFTTDVNLKKMVLDEAKIASCVRHENVVTTYGAEVVGDDLMLVMDYVAGVTLADLSPLKGNRLPPAVSAKIMADVLRGLHAAHDAIDADGTWLRIVHRDVSPQNIHVGVDGVARILDFGIAKAAHRLQATRVGVLKGKLTYMSPEQVAGKAIDHRADIYAAAVVLWELLTGRTLFAGANDAHTVTKILKGCAIAPSELASDIPRALDAIVMRGLALRADKRFDTALDMARAIEEVFSPSRDDAATLGAWVSQLGAAALADHAAIQRRLASEASPVVATNTFVSNRGDSSGIRRQRSSSIAPPRPVHSVPPPMRAYGNVPRTHRASRRAPTMWEVISSNSAGTPSRARLIFEALTVLAIVIGIVCAIITLARPPEAPRTGADDVTNVVPPRVAAPARVAAPVRAR